MILNSPTILHVMPLTGAVLVSEYSIVIARLQFGFVCVDYDKVIGLGFHFVYVQDCDFSLIIIPHCFSLN
jgi:hypothetical protein